jgi:hypothetical protein
LQGEQSREAEGIIPRNLLRKLFPKLALGFIPVILLMASVASICLMRFSFLTFS